MNGRTVRAIAVAVALLTGPVGCSSDTDAQPASGPNSPVRPITGTAATSTLYVSPDGNDENAGTETAQVQSITQAAEMAKPGTKIVVADGTYHGSVATKVSGTADARIAFVAANRGGAKIVGDARRTPPGSTRATTSTSRDSTSRARTPTD